MFLHSLAAMSTAVLYRLGAGPVSASCDASASASSPTMTPSLYSVPQGLFLVKNRDSFDRKVAAMRKDGPSKLQVVTDFDFTLTKFHRANYGGRGYSCHKCIEDCGYLSPDYHATAQALQRKYYPLEVKPGLTDSQRTAFMVEWVTQAHALLEKSALTEDLLLRAVHRAIDEGGMMPREGIQAFFTSTQRLGVPVLVFSAGIANVLEAVLARALGGGALPPHVTIASNRIHWDADTRRISGFREPLFHVFNKRASALSDSQLAPLTRRHNVLLLGDSLGDLNMSVGLKHREVLKVGFLNDRVDRLSEYLDKFDVVILGDPGLDVVMHLVSSLTTS